MNQFIFTILFQVYTENLLVPVSGQDTLTNKKDTTFFLLIAYFRLQKNRRYLSPRFFL